MMILTIFHVLIGLFISLLGEMCIQLFGLLFNQVVFFFVERLEEIFKYWIHDGYMICKVYGFGQTG